MHDNDDSLQQALRTMNQWMEKAREIAWRHLEMPTDQHVVNIFLALCQEVAEARDAARGVPASAGSADDDGLLLAMARGEVQH